MKTKFFTLFAAASLLGGLTLTAQDMSTGMDWDANPPATPILIDENFQGFEFFHSDDNPDMGNSNNTLDEDGETIIWGYTNIDKVDVPIINGGGGNVSYSFYQCAFAPEWMTAYAYKDLSATGSGTNTQNVSDGFVEVSREYGGAVPTVAGYFIVDLTSINFVDMIQWTHSSCGGTRRGVLLEISLDNGASWDTLRYQPGDAWSQSFTRDPFTGEDTPNTYNCAPSGYGMTWVEEIYMDNVMLRFLVAGGQVPRIHDLKVYGEYTASPVSDINEDWLQVNVQNKQIYLSQSVDVEIYNLSGILVKAKKNTNLVTLENQSGGIYFVKATLNGKSQITKVQLK